MQVMKIKKYLTTSENLSNKIIYELHALTALGVLKAIVECRMFQLQRAVIRWTVCGVLLIYPGNASLLSVVRHILMTDSLIL